MDLLIGATDPLSMSMNEEIEAVSCIKHGVMIGDLIPADTGNCYFFLVWNDFFSLHNS